MNDWRREIWFVRRDRAAMFWLVLSLGLAGFAVWSGHQEVTNQRAAISKLIELDRVERQAVAEEQSSWGGLAYYSFHLTYDRPSDFAFAAIGQRDTAPWMHRIRMLALEGQIYETDREQPEFGLIGRLDFSFLVAFILPLIAILLLHDLRAREQNQGRLAWLEATAGDGNRLWRQRLVIRLVLLAACMLIPLVLGAVLAGTPAVTLALGGLVVSAHLLFWGWLCSLVDRRGWPGPTKLTLLLGLWLGLVVVMPTVISTIAERMHPIPAGADIILTQREAVNQAWDLPKAATMDAFVERHPEWADHAQIEQPFEWRWYYAFQQVGDQVAEPLSQAYRNGIGKRDRLVGRLSWLSPPVWTNRTLQSLADTDVTAMQDYEQQIRDFHAALRHYYYPFLFEEQTLTPAAVADRPEFTARR